MHAQLLMYLNENELMPSVQSAYRQFFSTDIYCCAQSCFWSGRSQQVSVHGILASSFYLDFGVPHGSVLGPVLFLLYTADLVAMVQGFGLSAHVFADDLQVYCHFLDGKEQVALQVFRDCSESVSRWMSSNRLKLNPLKTELIWLHSSRRNPTFLRKDILLFGSPISK